MALNTRAFNGRVVAFAGGVGGAKLVHGLAQCLPPESLTIIGNTGDDFRYYGLHVSPDLDTVMYTLAGIAHPVNGWGLAGDTRQMVESLRALGEESWFGLGDKDLATNLIRTAWLAEGQPLSAVTARLCAALHIGPRLLPMTNSPLATLVHTLEYGRLAFQEYFVRYRWQPTVTRLEYSGEAEATPAPGVLDAIAAADLLVICPSNPVLSVEPILRVKAIREALTHRRVPCVAVSPVIAGAALKGPTVKIMGELGLRADVEGVSAYYGNLIDAIVIDGEDQSATVSQRALITDIRMRDAADRARLAAEILNWIGSLSQ